ncbi:MaoC family dehydratase [Streptomyces fuscichromogenes]|uniref:MaoC family dehydratase n=1 Tax=Streptomyces fuscichromogenes TaxID=1324013 RepID=UPI003809B218
MTTTTLTNAELLSASGRDLGKSEWIRVEQPRIDGFAEHTEDRQWIHVDPARAAEGPFGTTIAHGFLTLSLVPHLLAQVLHVSDETRGVNYGLDKVRFTNPVPVGAEIRLAAAVRDSVQRKDGGVMCRVEISVEIRGVERPALVGELVLLSYSG